MNEILINLLATIVQGWSYLNSSEFLDDFFNNRFYLILMVIVLMHLKHYTYRSMFWAAIINIFGTLLHELMHFIVGLVLNARPCNFTIFPKRNLEGYVMGSVSFRNITFYNAVPSALAPLLLLPLGFYINRYFLPEMKPTLINCILYILGQTIIIENAMPSKADFKIARMFISGVIFYLIVGIALISMVH